MMNFALATLRHDKSRFIPAIGAVTFSATLIALQLGLLIGLFSLTSIPIDHTHAHIWIGSPNVPNVDVGRPIPQSFIERLADYPDIDRVEVYIHSFGAFIKPDNSSDVCVVIGCNLEDNSLGGFPELTPELRVLLSEPGAVVIDESEKVKTGLHQIGDIAQISHDPRERIRRIRLVGYTKGVKSIAGAYVFCSIETARKLLSLSPDSTTYLLVTCNPPERAPAVVADLRRRYPDDMSVFTSKEFSIRTQKHWVTKTSAGIALGFAACLGLLVGSVITSQTLYAATMASMREYGVLMAMGIPRWRISLTVLTQSFWVGIIGTLLAFPVISLLTEAASLLKVRPIVPLWVFAATAATTVVMAIVSGLLALRSVSKIEPVNLLR
jgi:putative ABC transport system permease protein